MILPATQPLAGVDLGTVLRVLEDQHSGVVNLPSGDAEGRLIAFHRWASQAAEMLEYVLPTADVDRLIRTPRHDLLMGKATAYNEQLVNLTVNAEQASRRKAFEALIQQLNTTADHFAKWSWTMLVPDTNVYLHHETYFDDMSWPAVTKQQGGVHLLIPAAVLRELDRNKRASGQKKVSDSNSEPVRTRARVTSRRIRERFKTPHDVVNLSAHVRMELLLDSTGHSRLDVEDDEIIERAAAVQTLSGRRVTIITGDGNMQFAAQVAGLSVLPLPD